VHIEKTATVDLNGTATIHQRTKTESARRTIALMTSTIEALKRHKAKQNQRRLELGEHWQYTDLIFDRGDGQLVSEGRVVECLNRDIAAAGVPRITPHGMRHTSLTLIAATGESLHALKNRAGHATIAMTADLYARASQHADQRLVEALERLLGT
jgi:integrase